MRRSLQKLSLAICIAATIAMSIVAFKVGVVFGFIYLALACGGAALSMKKFPSAN